MQNPPSKYHYDPSLAAAITFAALFGISSVLHVFQTIRARTWYFIPFVVVGYSARAVNAAETPDWSQIPFIIQTLGPLLAPALYAASIYMLLGRIISSLRAEHLSFIPVRWLTKIFVFGDVLSFAFQCIGGGILSGADDKSGIDRGQDMILVGLGIQILFFACFMASISVFHYRILRQPTTLSLAGVRPWKEYVLVLYFTSLLILIRSIFRVAEFAEGQTAESQGSSPRRVNTGRGSDIMAKLDAV
ncbi:Protein RTA1 [Colletotrichum sp. SAR 10_65]|nr:Protein RTA1 [Colletotrichum sp. SAR 10_65]